MSQLKAQGMWLFFLSRNPLLLADKIKNRYKLKIKIELKICNDSLENIFITNTLAADAMSMPNNEFTSSDKSVNNKCFLQEQRQKMTIN